MRITNVLWDDQNEEHVRGHGVEPFEGEEVLVSRTTRFRHHGGPRTYALGRTFGGRYLFVVLDDEGKGWVYPVTARDMMPRERRLYIRRLLKKGRRR